MRHKSSASHFLLLVALIGAGPVSGGNGRAQNRSNAEARQFHDDRVRRLLSDTGDDQETLAKIFEIGNEAIPDLIRALGDAQASERAARALVYLGGPEERKAVRRAIGLEKNRERRWLMTAFFAGALVEPVSEEDWGLLRTCIKGYKSRDEGRSFASIPAALALGTNGSSRALRLLQIATKLDEDLIPDNEIGKAIRWIRQPSNREEVTSKRLDSPVEQVKGIVLANAFYAEGELDNTKVEKVVFTKDSARALAFVEVYRGPKDARGYEVVLVRNADSWRIVGVWYSWVA